MASISLVSRPWSGNGDHEASPSFAWAGPVFLAQAKSKFQGGIGAGIGGILGSETR